MSYKLEDIEGIGEKWATKLRDAGIKSANDLLKKCGAKKGRKEWAEKSGFDAKTLLKWANQVDLMRIKGVGSEYGELLEKSGVDTVKELRNRNVKNLTAKMAEVNAESKLVRVIPNEEKVQDWVNQAKKLDPAISH
ncbi:MAG: DUF4332 domain-containing protein [Planctomycetota bacterium]|jgi:predicted flap endonuclease-1-like 5' DNA nuclease